MDCFSGIYKYFCKSCDNAFDLNNIAFCVEWWVQFDYDEFSGGDFVGGVEGGEEVIGKDENFLL